MKLVTALYQNKEMAGVMGKGNETVLFLSHAQRKGFMSTTFCDTLLGCLQNGEQFLQDVHSLNEWVKTNQLEAELSIPLKDVQLLAPIPRPAKNIFCIGKNYAEHAIEMGSKDDIPEHVMVFTKAPTTVIGPTERILLHMEVTEQLDYEGELAFVIGKKGRAIKKEEAFEYIFGYTILNDITARDLQKKHQQFFIGKSLDNSAPMGPWIVTKDEIRDPGNLDVQTIVNGELRQSSNTKHFIFPIEEIISVLSKGMTLEPGDIIATGTPKGVGKGFTPPRFLKKGDKIDIKIENIGTLTNIVEE